MTTHELLLSARAARTSLISADTDQKNKALTFMAEAMIESTDDILRANDEDVNASRGIISDVMIDRLTLTRQRIRDMSDAVKQVAALTDPVGKILDSFVRPNGLKITKKLVPMGVIAVIYESRPNVTSDAAALAIKAGSSCVLRCGREAHNSALAIVRALKRGLAKADLPENCIELIEDTSRDSAKEIMEARGIVDLLIPRGGKGLIMSCVDNAKIPVLETGTGICHIYVDKSADIDMALDIVENAKTSRPSVCNAAEICLVHKEIAREFLPRYHNRLVTARKNAGLQPVELLVDPQTKAIIDGTPAEEDDYNREFLDYKMGVKIVDSVEEAIAHIEAHSTGHSDCIVTRDSAAADLFTGLVDSAAVYVNASTRFTDGGEFGQGCEIGISTQKLHARGPLGLEEICTFKYVIHGDGQTR